MASKRFLIVPEDSSAARMPLPGATMALATLLSSARFMFCVSLQYPPIRITGTGKFVAFYNGGLRPRKLPDQRFPANLPRQAAATLTAQATLGASSPPA